MERRQMSLHIRRMILWQASATAFKKAQEARMPVIILLGVGTNSGGHTGQSYLSQLIE